MTYLTKNEQFALFKFPAVGSISITQLNSNTGHSKARYSYTFLTVKRLIAKNMLARVNIRGEKLITLTKFGAEAREVVRRMNENQ